MRTRRSRTRLALVLLAALAASGCVTFNGEPTTTQVGSSDVGTTLRYSFSLCSNGNGSFPSPVTGGACAPTNSGAVSTYRVAIGVLVPTGSSAPTVISAALSNPVTITRDGVAAERSDLRAFRTTTVSADMNLEQAPPTGSTWVAYLSERITSSSSTSVSVNTDVTVDVALPTDAAGNPPSTAHRQVSIAMASDGSVLGTDELDGLAWDCYQPDADADGVAERAWCSDRFSPDAPAPIALRRLTLTAPAAISLDVGTAKTENLVLRLDGSALPVPAVSLASTLTGDGLSAIVPPSGFSSVGTDVSVPVTVTAGARARSGSLSIVARTLNGTERVVTVPINVTRDTTRPSTTITARRLASRKLRLAGRATDRRVSSGIALVKAQVYRAVGNRRCVAWTGTRFVRELCSRSTARWVTVVSTSVGTIDSDVTWAKVTPVIAPGTWLVRARATDATGFVSRIASTRVQVPVPPRRAR